MKLTCPPEHFQSIGTQLVNDPWLHAVFVWLNSEFVNDNDKTIKIATSNAYRMTGINPKGLERIEKLAYLEQLINRLLLDEKG